MSVNGTGNAKIKLQCPGAIKVIKVVAFGVQGNEETVSAFDQVCQDSITQVDNVNHCVVSLEKVYGNPYPPTAKTNLSYRCTYTTKERR